MILRKFTRTWTEGLGSGRKNNTSFRQRGKSCSGKSIFLFAIIILIVILVENRFGILIVIFVIILVGILIGILIGIQ